MNWRSLFDRLPTVLIILGVIAFVGGIGLYLVLGQFNRDVIVLLAVAIACWIYAALERPERTVQAFSGRGVRYGSNTAVMAVAFIAILVLVNYLANRFSDRFDLTQNQVFTLSPMSVQVVHELKQPVHVLAFYGSNDPSRTAFEDLLKEYTRQSSLITYEFIDPQLKPGLANQYKVQTFGTSVLVSGTKQQTITGSDEASMTSALLKLERNKAQVIYYTTGHGELDFSNSGQTGGSEAAADLQAQDYELKPLNLATSGQVPADASAVIVAGPTTPFLPQETAALEKYIDAGGKALILASKDQRPVLEPLAEKYGVQIGNGLVIDPSQSLMNDPLTPLINRYQASPVTKNLPALIFQDATSITPAPTPPAGYQVQPLAETTSQSWLETDPKVIHFDPGVDPQGPLSVMASVSSAAPAAASTGAAPSSSTTPHVLFIGDVAFASNNLVQLLGDKQLLSNAVNWLTANEDLIQIQAKSPTDQSLILSNTQLNILLYGSAVFLPLVVLGTGVLVWWQRR